MIAIKVVPSTVLAKASDKVPMSCTLVVPKGTLEGGMTSWKVG